MSNKDNIRINEAMTELILNSLAEHITINSWIILQFCHLLEKERILQVSIYQLSIITNAIIIIITLLFILRNFVRTYILLLNLIHNIS